MSHHAKIQTVDFDGVLVQRHRGAGLTIGYRTEVQRRRALMLVETDLPEGDDEFEIRQSAAFDTCGVMLDMSHGGAMRVEAVCDFIDKIATLGMNMFMLYTEDGFEMPEYPMFGYMRGRYTVQELRRVDDYAAARGVEVIPCIQTLGHLAKYLRWNEVPCDTSSVLLTEDERTYRFIECEIRTMKEAFRSRRIHIGMDEAYGLGRGQYLSHHPYDTTAAVFNRHLTRVLDITRQYGYEPMIWADMYYGDYYYDEDAKIDEEAVRTMPAGVTSVFWDYYHEDYRYYHKRFIQQEKLNNPTAFAGGIWSWDGFVPNFLYTMKTSMPALHAAIDHGVRTVFATAWGNDGTECDYRMMLSSLAVFSEMCWRGKSCTEDDIFRVAEYISGEGRELTLAVSDFACGEPGAVRLGKAMIYCDLLTDTLCRDVDFADMQARYTRSIAVLEKHPENPRQTYYLALFRAARGKAQLLATLRTAYAAGDSNALADAAQRQIPYVREQLDILYHAFCENWQQAYKPFDFERFAVRFGGLHYRLTYVAQVLADYVCGKRDRIEELEAPLVHGINVTWKNADFYQNY